MAGLASPARARALLHARVLSSAQSSDANQRRREKGKAQAEDQKRGAGLKERKRQNGSWRFRLGKTRGNLLERDRESGERPRRQGRAERHGGNRQGSDQEDPLGQSENQDKDRARAGTQPRRENRQEDISPPVPIFEGGEAEAVNMAASRTMTMPRLAIIGDKSAL